MNGMKHPFFVFGPGAGTSPQTYDDKGHYDRWASHGFVIYSPDSSTGNGSELKAGIDYLIAENDRQGSEFYQKLDTTKIAATGHSLGGESVFAMADDPRLTTTIIIAGGSMDGMGATHLRKPTAYICGATDNLATPNSERDYTATTVPIFMTVMDGVDHITAARMGWPAMIAWLRWHLAGEVERRAEFLDPNCEFCTGIWKSKSKNW
jgi:hypothetical protein